MNQTINKECKKCKHADYHYWLDIAFCNARKTAYVRSQNAINCELFERGKNNIKSYEVQNEKTH